MTVFITLEPKRFDAIENATYLEKAKNYRGFPFISTSWEKMDKIDFHQIIFSPNPPDQTQRKSFVSTKPEKIEERFIVYTEKTRLNFIMSLICTIVVVAFSFFIRDVLKAQPSINIYRNHNIKMIGLFLITVGLNVATGYDLYQSERKIIPILRNVKNSNGDTPMKLENAMCLIFMLQREKLCHKIFAKDVAANLPSNTRNQAVFFGTPEDVTLMSFVQSD